MTQIQEKKVDYYHLRARDNILISMKDQNDIDFIEEEQSAISQLDEDDFEEL